MFKKYMWYTLFAIVFIVEVVSQETATPASFLEPRDFNYHPYQLRQYLEEIKPTKQGPVLFPNDGPPPPRQPLVVTTRPLHESIANSDRNPNPPQPNNTAFDPVYPLSSPSGFSADLLGNVGPDSVSNNAVIGNGGQDLPDNNVPQATSYNHVPYADMLSKARLKGYVRANGFNDYEERTILPPIYQALSHHARQNVLKRKPTNRYNYQLRNLDYEKQYNNNDVPDENNLDYDQNQNYAFSYRVKDQKTGDDFSHKQQSVSGGTNGEYRVRLPDGRTQIVSYTADENGYKADVRYDEEKNAHNNYNYLNNGYHNNNIKQYDDRNIENNYVNRDYKEAIPITGDAQYNSKEYYDYSSEYHQDYEPYNSKFAAYKPTSTAVASTVRPYTESKPLYIYPTKSAITYSDGVISASNNPSLVKYQSTTEHTVSASGNKLYTNLKDVIPSLSTSTVENSFAAVTPASYLASTIASLRDRITAKPAVIGNFIDRINKYLTYK